MYMEDSLRRDSPLWAPGTLAHWNHKDPITSGFGPPEWYTRVLHMALATSRPWKASEDRRADLSAFAARAAGISDLRRVIEGGSSKAN